MKSKSEIKKNLDNKISERESYISLYKQMKKNTDTDHLAIAYRQVILRLINQINMLEWILDTPFSII